MSNTTPDNLSVPEPPPMQWDEINGFFDFEDIYLSAVSQAGNDAVFVEVGAWLGCSIAFLAHQVREQNKDILIYAVDTWMGNCGIQTYNSKPGNNAYQEFLDNMLATGSLQYVRPLRMLSVEASQLFNDNSLDMVFIDADHCYPAVKADLHAWYPKVKPGGIFAGHDYKNAPGVKQAVDEFLNDEMNIPFNLTGRSWQCIKPSPSRNLPLASHHTEDSENRDFQNLSVPMP